MSHGFFEEVRAALGLNDAAAAPPVDVRGARRTVTEAARALRAAARVAALGRAVEGAHARLATWQLVREAAPAVAATVVALAGMASRMGAGVAVVMLPGDDGVYVSHALATLRVVVPGVHGGDGAGGPTEADFVGVAGEWSVGAGPGDAAAESRRLVGLLRRGDLGAVEAAFARALGAAGAGDGGARGRLGAALRAAIGAAAADARGGVGGALVCRARVDGQWLEYGVLQRWVEVHDAARVGSNAGAGESVCALRLMPDGESGGFVAELDPPVLVCEAALSDCLSGAERRERVPSFAGALLGGEGAAAPDGTHQSVVTVETPHGETVLRFVHCAPGGGGGGGARVARVRLAGSGGEVRAAHVTRPLGTLTRARAGGGRGGGGPRRGGAAAARGSRGAPLLLRRAAYCGCPQRPCERPRRHGRVPPRRPRAVRSAGGATTGLRPPRVARVAGCDLGRRRRLRGRGRGPWGSRRDGGRGGGRGPLGGRGGSAAGAAVRAAHAGAGDRRGGGCRGGGGLRGCGCRRGGCGGRCGAGSEARATRMMRCGACDGPCPRSRPAVRHNL